MVDMLRKPKLRDADINAERDVIVRELAMRGDDPGTRLHQLLDRTFYRGHALAREIGGSVEVVKNTPEQKLRDYFKKHYNPENIVLSVAGNVEHEQVVKLAEEMTQGWEGRGRTTSEPFPTKSNHETRIAIEHDPTLQETKLALALPIEGREQVDPKVDEATQVLAHILGGGMSSRLFREVREKRGLAYGISAGTQRYERTGMFAITTGVQPDKVGEALGVIVKELRRVKEQGVTQQEVDQAKEAISGKMLMASESSGTLGQRARLLRVLQRRAARPRQGRGQDLGGHQGAGGPGGARHLQVGPRHRRGGGPGRRR